MEVFQFSFCEFLAARLSSFPTTSTADIAVGRGWAAADGAVGAVVVAEADGGAGGVAACAGFSPNPSLSMMVLKSPMSYPSW
ncbi:MAG: hypothetical protein OJF50_004070 [Nitrospira sp.]|nr:hypothetical protein [Nitrospira sp.]